MSLPVVLHPLASLEFAEAVAWYEDRRQGLGEEFKSEVDRTFLKIADTPERFRPVRGDIRRAMLRRFPYAIHFVPKRSRIFVLAVFHSKRDPRHLENRR